MRMSEGKETWHRLLQWDRGQTAAERLAAIILTFDGFKKVDPSHPLGGKDGLKDMLLSFEGKKWVGAVYFPRGQQSFDEISKKFKHDLNGVEKNSAGGFAFLTNQELRLGERKKLTEMDETLDIQVYHLERISMLLNTPVNYGVRMEFLDIEMSKEEQLSFFSTQSEKMHKIESALEKLTIGLEEYKLAQIDRNITLHTEHQNDIDDYFDSSFYNRTEEEIMSELDELLDKIWFDRHMSLRYRVQENMETVDPEIWKGALKSAEKVISKYGATNLGPYSDFEWGMLNGKLSALRWVIGEEWDMLDT